MRPRIPEAGFIGRLFRRRRPPEVRPLGVGRPDTMRRRVRLGCLSADGVRVRLDGWVVGLGREGFLFEPFPSASPDVGRVHTAFLRFGFDVREATPAGCLGGLARFAFTKPLRPKGR